MMMEILKKGDLVHIPQDVVLWEQVRQQTSSHLPIKTDRPRTAVYLGVGKVESKAESYIMRSDHRSLIFLDGKQFGVRCDQVYLLNKKTQEKVKSAS